MSDYFIKEPINLGVRMLQGDASALRELIELAILLCMR